MRYALLVALPLLALPASGEVLVTFHTEPIALEQARGASLPAPAEPAVRQESTRGVPSLLSVVSALNRPSSDFWYVPRFNVDTSKPADSTLWAVRNEGTSDVSVQVRYFDTKASLQLIEVFTIAPKAVKTRNVRDVSPLTVDPDGFARGLITFDPSGPISVDQFSLDVTNNFATGSLGFNYAERCELWMVRYLRFFASAGTRLNAFVFSPKGTQPTDLPSLMGNVYSEAGAFLGAFTVKTDEWSLELDLHDLIPPGSDFGTIELKIASDHPFPGGFVQVSHPALDRFSVGTSGVCLDPAP